MEGVLRNRLGRGMRPKHILSDFGLLGEAWAVLTGKENLSFMSFTQLNIVDLDFLIYRLSEEMFNYFEVSSREFQYVQKKTMTGNQKATSCF